MEIIVALAGIKVEITINTKHRQPPLKDNFSKANRRHNHHRKTFVDSRLLK